MSIGDGASVVAQFTVIGDPKPQGSKTAFKVGNHARMKDAAGAGHATWRDAVATAAARERSHLPGPLDGELELDVVFRFRMPASARKADRVRGWRRKTTAPDLSKLVRALEDGLQAAGLISDDARITRLHANKVDVVEEWTGAEILVRVLPTIELWQP